MRLPAPILVLLLAATIVTPAAAFEERAAEPQEREPPPQRMELHELERRAAMHVETAPVGAQPVQSVLSPAGLDWVPLGPRPIEYEYWSVGPASGRVSAIVVNPFDGNVVYVGAAGGGVWKTTNGGIDWTPLTDGLSSMASGALALDPTNPDVVYFATGEQHYSGDSFYGDGLFRSTNGGTSWTKIATATNVGSYIARITVSPINPNVLMIAGSRGLIRSLDGGATWSVMVGGNWADDLVVDPLNPLTAYTSIYGVGIFKTTAGGGVWMPLGGGLPTGGFGRINLAISPSNPLVLYASFVINNGSLGGMFRTTDGGTTWSLLPSTPNYLGTQGWYDNTIVVDPTDANVCYAGGVFPYSGNTKGIIRTTNGGTSWSDITTAGDGTQAHPDQHVLTFGPDGTLWLGNDGGVWKTHTPGATWINCNNRLANIQFYTLGLHPTNANRILGGTQDNGALEFAGVESWPQVVSGDGGPVAYAPGNPDYFYTTYVQLDPLYEWNLGSFVGDVTGPWSAAGDRADWCNGPLVADPNAAFTLLAGTYRVWRSPDGGGVWGAPLSPDLTGGNGVLRAIAVAPGASNTIYTGSSDGRVFVTTNATLWNLRNAGLPPDAIPDVIIDPSNPQTAYLCSDRGFGPRVFKTIDSGVTWNSLTGDLPIGFRALSLAIDFRTALYPRLYLGTDYGVFVSANNGLHWTKASANFPNCPVYDLAVDAANNFVIAATHGRGMWRAVPDVIPPAAIVASPNGGETWIYGTAHDITWNASDAAGIDSVRLVLSTDGGATYPTTIAGPLANSGVYHWTVPTLAATAFSRVRVIAYDPSGNGGTDVSDRAFYIADPTLTGVEGGEVLAYALQPVSPNPTRAPARVAYALPERTTVSLEIFDLMGRRARVLESGEQPAGRHEVSWDGTLDGGAAAGAGIYYVRLRAGRFEQSRRVVLMR